MAHVEARPPVQPGEPAPDFTVPAVQREGSVSLADYRGRTPLLLALFRGLYCPFCRRNVVQLGLARDKLQAVGVETLGIVATNPERARMYLRFRPTRLSLGADAQLTTHRAFGVPQPAITPELMQAIESSPVNPTGELPHPMNGPAAMAHLNAMDKFEMTETDQEESNRHGILLTGQFLVDRDGIVRWANVEGAVEGPAGLGKFPSDEELLAVARAL